MNKNMLILAIIAGSAFSSVTANAASGTINFTGNVTADACTVDSASQSQTVALGTIGATDFASAGATSGNGKITVVLSSCPAATTKASVSFGGPINSANPDLLALSSSSTATNLGIALYEADGTTKIPMGSPSKSQNLTAGGTTNLVYQAKYMSTAATVTAGSANAAADFTVLYN